MGQNLKHLKREIKRTLKVKGINLYLIREGLARKERPVPHMFGLLSLYLAVSMLLPLSVAVIYREDVRPWLYPILLSGMIAGMVLSRCRSSGRLRSTEAMFIVAMVWLTTSVVGALPYIMYGMGPIDAIFETMSGFTTTGATIMTSIESWPESLLLWRSFTQWLGGAGIIMLFVAVLPVLGVGGRYLTRNESPGSSNGQGSISLRIKDEARKFTNIYLGLSGVLLVLLLLGGIGIYDSFAVMFSTVSTGGFSPHTQSISFYGNPVIEWTVIAFMFISGVNFYLHYTAISSRRIRTYFKSSEFCTYLALMIIASAMIFLLVWDGSLANIEYWIRTSMFQVASTMTSTGFATIDFAQWEKAALFILFGLMVIGGCTGSTAGGLKVARLMLTREFVYSTLYKTVHPRSVYTTKMDGKPMSENVLSSLMAVLICYILSALACTIVLVILGIDPTTSMSAAITTLSNVGPGMGALGPMGTFAGIPDLGKIALTITMWAGRLEFIAVFVILTPVFWRELLRYKS
ncbi:MAG TPA: TrkH family potassium uptake protein [Methanomassiliicoccales archaeon]|jgi:trk system potassium uptake protein TrkH